MKKLLLVLLVVSLASFLFVGCNLDGVIPAEGEGEGEGETAVVVAVSDSITLDGKTYVKGGKHTITATFPTPVVGNVIGGVSSCGGSYPVSKTITVVTDVVMFPDAERKVWTGSATFSGDDCCAAYVLISAGECTDEYCIMFPIVVDSGIPYAQIKVVADDCTCEGIALTFASLTTTATCADDTECCGDDCTGLASWAIDIYNQDPFDECCDTPCVSPVFSCSGSGCAISCVTDCLPDYSMTGYASGGYYVVTTLLDEMGNKSRYYVTLEAFDSAFVAAVTAASTGTYRVDLTEYAQDKFAVGTTPGKPGVCSWFCDSGIHVIHTAYDTGEYGFCSDSPDNVITGTAADPCM